MSKNKDYDVSFSDLPEQTFANLEDGIYILKIEDIIKEDDPNYGMKYTMTHDVINTGRKVNFDNYKIYDKDGNNETFGQGKLRKLLEATGLDTLERINVKVLKAVAVGKMFKAKCDITDRGYVNIHYADIFPLDYEKPALNEGTATEAPAPKETTVSPASTPSDAVVDEVDDDDI